MALEGPKSFSSKIVQHTSRFSTCHELFLTLHTEAMLPGRSGRVSTLPGLKTPAHRNHRKKSIFHWLEDKCMDDGAEGLWRIHDNIYDFSSFLNYHPGGIEWLQLTKGTDITEAFESHHVSSTPSRLLERYLVIVAKTPRNSPYTFHEDGFYAKLRRKAFNILSEKSAFGPSYNSCFIADVLVSILFVTAMLASKFQNAQLAVFAGIFLGFNTSTAHNFFHMRDNFRRYYFDLSLLSSSSWRISHALSHHLYPNSITDLEISMPEPFFYWLPYKDKTLIERYLTWVTSPVMYSLVFPLEFLRRTIRYGVHKTDFLGLLLPAVMLIIAPSGHIFNTLRLWIYIVLCGSFYTISTSINGAHHHPDIYHDGDAHRADLDWGLQQLDSVRDRPRVSGAEGSWKKAENDEPVVTIDNTRSFSTWTLFKVLTNFGHHSLHHLFPTIDHAYLPYLYPALAETLTEFRVPFKTMSVTELVIGQFQQLASNVPNNIPPPYLPKPNKVLN